MSPRRPAEAVAVNVSLATVTSQTFVVAARTNVNPAALASWSYILPASASLMPFGRPATNSSRDNFPSPSVSSFLKTSSRRCLES